MYFMRKIACLVLCFVLLVSLVSVSASSAYTPGEYTAQAQGNNGLVEVSLSFDENSITAAEVIAHFESAGIADSAIENIPKAIVNHQTLAIDAVSGATNTSNAILEAAASCVEKAGGDVAALKAKDPVSATEKVIDLLTDISVDVLVIGGGGAGLSAALSASENGATVLLVEKTDALGGNTLRSGGAFNSYDPEGQALIPMIASLERTVEAVLAKDSDSEKITELKMEVQKQWDEYKASGSTTLFDSSEWHALQSLDSGDYIANVDLMRTLTSNALETKHWLADNGVQWLPEIRTVVGAMWNRSAQTHNTTGKDFIVALENAARQNKAQIYLNSKADELLFEEGRVQGALITNANGDQVKVIANKGVILATGGFSANVEMRVKHNKHWDDLGDSIKTNNHPGATGDGIFMGESVGAALVDMEWIQLMPLNPVSGGGISGYVNNVIYINQDGNRFVAEDSRRDVLAQGALAQENALFYIVNDQAEVDRVGLSKEALNYMVANKMLFKGESLEDLAQQIGADPVNLVKAVEEFNASVVSGSDAFGRTTFDQKIDTAPYYTSSFSPAVHHTMGGLVINTNAQVLNQNGDVIPGFFAAGEVTGGIHGTNRVGGNAVPDALVFGKIAGEMAVNAE